MALKERTYPREVFFAAFGTGPYQCYFCHESVEFEDAVVHHLDQNRAHNHPYNLVGVHLGCHNRWHNALRKGVPRSAIIQRHLRTVNVGRKLTPEHKAAISWKGRSHSPETRAKMRATALRRHRANPGGLDKARAKIDYSRVLRDRVTGRITGWESQ